MLTRSAVLLGFTLALGLSSADASPREPSEKDRRAVLEARARLIHAMETDNLEALFAGLTADHVTMPPDGPSMSKSKELRAWHEQRISAYAISGNWASEELRLQGDWAIDSWRGLTILTPRGAGKPIEMMTKGVWFWRRGPDGAWKLARSIWNGDAQTARPDQAQPR